MKKQTLGDLTGPMRTALIHCYGRGVKPHEFTDDGRWTPATLAALQKHGLVYLAWNRRNCRVWRATEQGRFLITRDVPRFLHRDPARNYTTRLHEAAWGEPEAA